MLREEVTPRRTVEFRTAGLRPAPLRLHVRPGRGFIPSIKRTDRSSLPIAQPHPRKPCARRSTRPTRAAFSSLPIACPEARRAQPYSSLAVLYHLRSFTRSRRHCVPHPQHAIALHLAFKTGSNPPLAQPHPRNMVCAPKRADQPNRREPQFSSLPIALIHPRNTHCVTHPRRAICTSYRWPPAGGVAFDSATTSGSGFIPSVTKRPQFPTACAASSAQHGLRAQARSSTRPTRAAFSSLPICADSPAQDAVACRCRRRTELTVRPA